VINERRGSCVHTFAAKRILKRWRADCFRTRFASMGFSQTRVDCDRTLLHTPGPVGGSRSGIADHLHGSIAKGLSLVAIVVGGLVFAFGELAGIIGRWHRDRRREVHGVVVPVGAMHSRGKEK